MKFRKQIFLFTLSLISVSFLLAQTDTEFWFAAPPVTSEHENTPEVFRISCYATTAVVTISEPANPYFSPYNVTLLPYSSTTVQVTPQLNMVENKPGDKILNYGIRISATANISAYYEVGIKYNPEIFPLKGALATGLKFLIPSQTTLGNGSAYSMAKNGFVIVATQDNTNVTITFSNADSIHAAGSSFTFILNKGQTYATRAASQYASQHLGGSTIVADKAVSVTIYDDSLDGSTLCGTCTCKDLIGDQILPENNNGSEFIIVRGALSMGSPGDYYYIWPTVNGTDIKVNGASVGKYNRGSCYSGIITSSSLYVVTSSPAYLYQMTGIGCEVAATNLPSINCTGSPLVSFVRSTDETFQLNLLCKTADIDSFYVNGVRGIITRSLFETVPNTNGAWQAARITAANFPSIDYIFPAASTSVVSNTNGLFHLGFMNGSSTIGARLGYFSNYSTVKSSPSIASGTTCYGSDIQLSSTLSSGATYQWEGPNGFSRSVYNPVIPHATLASSGIYKLTASIPGCATSTDSLLVTVHPLPAVSFSKMKDTVCYGSSKNINFSLAGTAPWKFVYSNGTANDTINTIKSSPYYFTGSPKTTTIYSVKTIVDSNSCAMDATDLVSNYDTLVVNALPVANFGFTTPRCATVPIFFSDSSKADLDTLVHWYWNMDNGHTKDFYSKPSFSESYTDSGHYTIKLAVQSSQGCLSDTLRMPITINSLPKPGFILPDVCFKDPYAQFIDTTSIPDHQNSFTYHWNFGDINSTAANADTSILQNPKHKYLAAGFYNISLKVTSGNGCIDSIRRIFTVNGAIPKADFSLVNSLLCSNDSIRIKDSATVDFGSVTKVKSYWDYTNAPSIYDSTESPFMHAIYSHLYPNFQQPAVKSFRIHYQAYSGITCMSSKDTIITVNSSPDVQFNTIPGICYDASPRQITQAIETGKIDGIFTYSGTGVDAGGIFTPKSAGVSTDSIQALYVSFIGCRDSAKQAITVWPSPTAQWKYSNPDCEKNNITLTDNSVANFSKINSWSWVFGDNTSAVYDNNAAFAKQYQAYGSYTVALKVTTDSGCSSQAATQVIKVNPLPHVNFDMPSVVCLPDGNAQFSDGSAITDNTSPLFSYRWNFDDPGNTTVSTLKNPVHRFTALGPYNIQLIVTSGDNCVDSLTQIFSGIYPQPKAGFTIDSKEICMSNSISFSDASTNYTGSIQAWKWDLAEGYTATTQNTTRAFADSGTYQISLYITDAKGCNSDTAVQNVIVDPYPHLSLPHNIFVLQGGNTVISPVFYANAPVFSWAPSTYLSSADSAYPVTTPEADITYTLTLTGQGNCSVSDYTFVKVLLTPVIPNVFSPNGDGINDTWIIQYLDSYPNCIVEVFDRGGQPVFRSTGYKTPWNGTYNGTPLPIGTYYYIINPKNKRAVMSGSVTIIR